MKSDYLSFDRYYLLSIPAILRQMAGVQKYAPLAARTEAADMEPNSKPGGRNSGGTIANTARNITNANTPITAWQTHFIILSRAPFFSYSLEF
jgi:hypothetical protein